MAEPLSSRKLPRGVVHFRADAEGWLRGAGYLADGQGLLAVGREVVNATPSRENAILSSGPRGTPAFEKRSRTVTLSDLRKVLIRARRPTSPLLHEWAMLWRARERGIRVPEPVAAGLTRGLLLTTSDFLITETLAGRSLDALLEEDFASMPAARRRTLADAVGRAVAGLHAAGIAFPDLYAKHVFLEPSPGGAWAVGFLDLTSAYATPRISPAERARGLGALAASLPFRLPLPVLMRFLRSYLAGVEGWDLRDAWGSVANAARRHLRLRRFRTGLAGQARPMAGDPAPDGSVERRLLQRFDVPVIHDARAVEIRDELAGPLERLLLATFRAGLLPMGDVLPHVRLQDDGRLAWDARAPLRAPRRARAIHARWRLVFLRREIARSAFSPAAKRSLISWAGGEPVAAFALSSKRL
jgi:hypothetical protein